MADLPIPPKPPESQADAEAEILSIEERGFPELDRQRWQLEMRVAYLQGVIAMYRRIADANDVEIVED